MKKKKGVFEIELAPKGKVTLKYLALAGLGLLIFMMVELGFWFGVVQILKVHP